MASLWDPHGSAGGGCTVLSGVTIGERSFVAAGTVGMDDDRDPVLLDQLVQAVEAIGGRVGA